MHGRGRPVFSFEFFPPKDEASVAHVLASVADLKEALAPNFVSVTNGAGGSTRARTLDTVTITVTLPMHAGCDIGRGLAVRILKDAGFSVDDFLRLR